jgi:hypothetical protein
MLSTPRLRAPVLALGRSTARPTKRPTGVPQVSPTIRFALAGAGENSLGSPEDSTHTARRARSERRASSATAMPGANREDHSGGAAQSAARARWVSRHHGHRQRRFGGLSAWQGLLRASVLENPQFSQYVRIKRRNAKRGQTRVVASRVRAFTGMRVQRKLRHLCRTA